MLDAFSVVIVFMLVGMILALVLIDPPGKGGARHSGGSGWPKEPATRDWTVMRAITLPWRVSGDRLAAVRSRSMAWVGMFALFTALVGCSDLLPHSDTAVRRSTPTSPPTSATTPAVLTTPTVPALGSDGWTTYHGNNARTGYLASEPDPRQLTRAWSTRLDGAVYAEPLIVGGHVLVATEGDSLYSLAARTGQVEWRTNIGRPVPLSTLPCGNIDPLGITGTPVYDAKTGLVFAVAEVSGPAHILVGVDAGTGQVRVRRSADPAGMESRTQQQRAALALFKGMVYIAYGGLDGDCGNYHGWVVASRTDGKGPLYSYQVPTTNQGGIWAPSGPAVDAAGHLYVAVGNGQATQGHWDHSDSVLRLSPSLRLEDGFAPTRWPQDNATDADLGSMGPLLLPGGMVFADGKSGLGYLLHADALGGIGGQALVKVVCHAYGGAALLGSVLFVPCSEGLRQVKVGPGIRLTLGWHALRQVNGSPVVGGHTVYSLNPHGGVLYALDISTGMVRATVAVGSTSRFATPTLSGGFVFVGTLMGVAAVVGS